MNKFDITEFDEEKVSEKDLRIYYDFFTEILKEFRPDDPTRPYDKFKKQILNYSDSYKIKRWVIWEDEIIIAYIIMYVQLEGENRHITDVDIFVRKEWRSKGIAKILLKKLYDETLKENCTMMEFSTFSTVHSGTEFLKIIGAKLGSTEHVNQLKLEDIDMVLMDKWIERAKERASDYELELWKNEYPEDKIDSFVKLYNDFWNSVPLDDLEYKHENISAKWLKNGLEASIKRGWEDWIMVARHKPTNVLAGFTHVVYTGFIKELINQDDTGVAKEHRNKGLGRLLKASMIKLIKEEMSEIKFVRSENAVSNKTMLNINFEMGFKPYYSEAYWQIKVQKVKEYLEKR